MVTRVVIAIFLVCCCIGCNESGADRGNGASLRVLQQQPYRPITDSIDKFPKDAALYLRRAERLMQGKYTALAMRDYQKAWQLKPDEANALYYASSLFMTGDEEEGINVLKEGIKRFPQNPEFPRRLSEAYIQSGQPEQALRQYNNILQQDPGNFEAWYEKGVILTAMKDTAEAIAALEKAYSLQPLQLFGISLANLYAETKNSKAISLCDDLIARDQEGQLTDPIFLKGIYYSNTHQSAAALQQFETCIKKDWKFTEAYIEKGIVYFEQHEYADALKTFKLAAEVSNTYADAYFWMGRVYEATGKKVDAKENYYKALALDRNFSEAKQALVRLGE